MAGKGDKRRPSFVSDKEFSKNWDLAFGSKSQKRRKEIQNRTWLQEPGPQCTRFRYEQ